MKKTSIFFTLFLAMLYITLSSDKDGAAHHGHGDITGATTGTVGHCQTGSCHGGNNAGTIVRLQVIDTATMLPITVYNAHQTYLITLTGDATSIPTSLPAFGFQVSAVRGNHTLAGTYTLHPSYASTTQIISCGATTVVEQNAAMRQAIVDTNKYYVAFYWTAPAPVSDSVSFYALLNAVNENNAKSGDYPNAAPKVTIYENPADTKVAQVANPGSDISVFPNPATTQITVQSTNQPIDQVTITNLAGQTMYSQQSKGKQAHIDISAFPKGMYIMIVNNAVVRKFVKE